MGQETVTLHVATVSVTRFGNRLVAPAPFGPERERATCEVRDKVQSKEPPVDGRMESLPTLQECGRNPHLGSNHGKPTHREYRPLTCR